MLQTGIISDVKQDVLDALQGRTDISDSQISRYVQKTVSELTESQPFPELEQTGPQLSLTIGQSTYPISIFLNTGDNYASAISMPIYIDVGTNSILSGIRYKIMPAIETLAAPAVQGIPAWFTRYGNNFILGPVPNNTYTVFLRYQVKHPKTPTPQLTDPLYIASSWYDIVAYGAAQRIAVTKRWNDQAKFLHDLLYGDPEYVNSQGLRGRPGLIAARKFQQERDEPFNSRQLNVVVARYNSR